MGTSIFEIIGPIMVGPSSSHTAGMARIGMMAHRIVDTGVKAIHLELSPMLRTTYRGHRTDAALVGGAIGLCESDPDIRNALRLAENRGILVDVSFFEEGKCPQNTAQITAVCTDGQEIKVLGTSIGGGSIVISAVDDVPMNILPEAHHIVVWSTLDAAAGLAEVEADSRQSGIRNEQLVTCLTFSESPGDPLLEELRRLRGVRKISVVEPVLEYGVSRATEKKLDSCRQVIREAAGAGKSVAQLAVEYEMARSGYSEESIRSRMSQMLHQMKESVRQGEAGSKLLYGLASGEDGKRLMQAVRSKATISGGIVPLAVARALGVMEYNGSMGCIVAAPTAGSSGIVPGCMITIREECGFSDEKLVDALFVSGMMGVIMANRSVSFSGSVGGCQGEVGVSSAISAAGLTSLFTDDPEKIFHAMALCLKNLLGLVCDPIAGPIEIPCIKRNAVGVANAFISADMALAGIQSFIPPDEVIDALVDVEKRLPQELKCATTGGLACTRTARRIRGELSAV